MSNPLVSMVPYSSYLQTNSWLRLWTKCLIKNIPLSFCIWELSSYSIVMIAVSLFTNNNKGPLVVKGFLVLDGLLCKFDLRLLRWLIFWSGILFYTKGLLMSTTLSTPAGCEIVEWKTSIVFSSGARIHNYFSAQINSCSNLWPFILLFLSKKRMKIKILDLDTLGKESYLKIL